MGIQNFTFPETARKLFIEHILPLSDTHNPYHDFEDIASGLGYKLKTTLKDVSKQEPENKSLADALIELFESTKNSKGPAAFSINNLPTDENLPPTPQIKDNNILISQGLKKGYISEYTLLAISNLIGQKPMINKGMQGDLPFQQIIPIPEMKDKIVNSTPDDLPMHTETTYNENPPQYIMLLGLKSGISKAKTDLIFVDDLILSLSEEERKILQKPNYKFISGDGLDKGNRSFEGPVLSYSQNGDFNLRLVASRKRVSVKHGLSKAETILCEKALDKIISITNDKQHNEGKISTEVMPGQLLCVDNNRALHGRTVDKTQSSDQLDPEARWITRTYTVPYEVRHL